MNVAENTAASRSRIEDADFSVESANRLSLRYCSKRWNRYASASQRAITVGPPTPSVR